MINIGIIGLGVISHYYLAVLKGCSIFNLHSVCDTDINKLNKIEDQHIKRYTNYHDMLNDKTLDAVVINVPNVVHFEICQVALQCGKNVCCEKPLTINLENAMELYMLSKRVNKTLFTAFHRRYNTNYLKMLEKLPERKKLVKVVAEYKEKIQEHAGNDSWYLNPESCGGGCIADNGPNVFDSLLDFLSDLSVDNVVIHDSVNNVELNAEIQLRTIDNIPVEVFLDWNYDQGERKTISLYLNDGTILQTDMLANYPIFKSSLYHEYDAVLKDFANNIHLKQGRGETGVKVTYLVEQCYQILKNNSKELIQ